MQKLYHILFFILPTPDKEPNGVKQRQRNKLKRQKYSVLCIFAFVLVLLVFSKDSWASIQNAVTGHWTNVRNLRSNETRHIGFLKVHKAGSTTIQNVLFRFGLKRNLTFIIPKNRKHHRFTRNEIDKTRFVEVLKCPSQNYLDILAIHSVFNESVYSSFLAKDAIYIAVVREPLELFISGAYYYRDLFYMNYLRAVPNNNYIKNLIRYPERYDSKEYSWTKNSMALDFGFPRGLHINNVEEVNSYLQYLDSEFHLVMVMEKFDESLVLLKRLLKWQLQDILYIPSNQYKHYSVDQLNITVLDRIAFQARNYLDVAIYEYFAKRFARKVKQTGNKFSEEVQVFIKIKENVAVFCKNVRTGSFHVDRTHWNEEFVVSVDDCDMMLLSEQKFIDKIRDIMLSCTPKNS